MQLSLFDKNHMLTGRFQKSLERLDLDGALKTLKLLKAVGNPLHDVTEKTAALLSLIAEPAFSERSDPAALGNLYLRLEHMKSLQALSQDMRCLKKGFILLLSHMLQTDAGYICPDLHAAEVFCLAGQFDSAIRTASSAIKNKGEEAFLRQLIGWSYFKQHDAAGAIQHLSMALFFDATACRESFLPEETFLITLQALQREYANPDLVWTRLPLELWSAKKIHVYRDDAYLVCLRQKIAHNPDLPGNKAAGEGLLFNRLLYLAEILRLTRMDYDEMIRVRLQMKALNAEHFKEYLDGIGAG